MNFTREDILKILNALLQLGRKDSEFKDANTPLNSEDYIAILLDGINKKVSINNLLSTLGLLKKDDFINVSDRYDEYYIQLSEAITIIANNKRKKGLVITFQDINGSWRIYQFNDEISNFIKTEYWKDLFDFKYNIVNSILPDEEDLTLTYPNIEGNSFIQLKNKEYDPLNFSGMATKILRKNIVEVNGIKKNILTQDVFDLENCIYEIRYDFTLIGNVTIPANCVLEFDGGSINGSYTITGNDTRIIASPIKIFGINIIIAGTWNVKAYIEWFGAIGDGVTDDSNAMTACLSFKTIELQSKTYLIKMVDIVLDNTHIWGVGNATVYNNEWGPWSFRTNCNYIEIDHINFKAIPHIQVTRTYPGDEHDNGASAILAKGSYCCFHDLYIEEFYVGVWLGGDYLDVDHMQEGNVLYNINCHNINFNSAAWQKGLVVHDIYGDYATFTSTSYDGTYEEGEFAGNPGHLVYLTGNSYDATVYNISSNYRQGNGSTLAVKYVTKGNIYNINSYKQSAIQSDSCVEVKFYNITITQSNVSDEYVLNIRTATKCIFENISIIITDTVNVFRLSYSDNIYLRNIFIGVFGEINYSAYILNVSGSSNVVIENSNFPSFALDKNTRIWLNADNDKKVVLRNVRYDGNPGTAIKAIEPTSNILLDYPGDVVLTKYNSANELSGYTDRHAYYLYLGHIKEYIIVDDNKQVTFPNVGSMGNIEKEYIIINAGSSTIPVRLTDVSDNQIVHSNYSDYDYYYLVAGKAIKLEVAIFGLHVIINKTDIFTQQ